MVKSQFVSLVNFCNYRFTIDSAQQKFTIDHFRFHGKMSYHI